MQKIKNKLWFYEIDLLMNFKRNIVFKAPWMQVLVALHMHIYCTGVAVAACCVWKRLYFLHVALAITLEKEKWKLYIVCMTMSSIVANGSVVCICFNN